MHIPRRLATLPGGGLLVRPRVSELMGDQQARATVLVAPDGSGKTVAAAHFARGHDSPVIWLDCEGLEVTPSEVASALDGGRPGTARQMSFDCAVPRIATTSERSCLLVLDNMAPAVSSESLVAIHDLLGAGAPAPIAITTPGRRPFDDLGDEVRVVNAHALALTEDEALGLATEVLPLGGLSCASSAAAALVDAVTRGAWSDVQSRVLDAPRVHRGPSQDARDTLLALAFAHTGRLAQARDVLGSHSRFAPEGVSRLIAGAMVSAAGGAGSVALDALADALCSEQSEHDSLAGVRVLTCAAIIAAAEGLVDSSLEWAERARARVERFDPAGRRPWAAAALAGALVALGDDAAADEAACDALRSAGVRDLGCLAAAAAVHAVIHLREGDTSRAIDILAPFAGHVRSGSANWVLAMHCRIMPELLGILAAAVGSTRLPVHLLRMLPQSDARRAVCASRGTLEDGGVRRLAERTLGADSSEAILAAAQPICHVRMFGGLEVVIDGRRVSEADWKKRKARLLFAMVAVHRGRDVARDALLEYLWPNLAQDRARNNFYVAWSTMKSALAGPGNKPGRCRVIECSRGRCRIDPHLVGTDVDDFERAVAEAHDARNAGALPAALAATRRMIALYRGDLLPGDIYDDWFAPFRVRYRAEFLEVLSETARALLHRGETGDAAELARRALQLESSREDLYQLLLRCQILSGQRSAAVDTFMACRTRLAEDLGLDPSAATLELYQQVLVMDAPGVYAT